MAGQGALDGAGGGENAVIRRGQALPAAGECFSVTMSLVGSQEVDML